MADFKRIASAYPNAASNTSLTSAFEVRGEFSHFAIAVPSATAWCATTTCGFNVLGASSSAATFYEIAYSNNPATATSGHRIWDSAGSAAVNGAMIICEALQFVPGWAKLRMISTATASTEFVIYGRKFD